MQHFWVWAVTIIVATLALLAIRKYGNTSAGFRLGGMVGLLLASGVCADFAIGYIEASQDAGAKASQLIVLSVFFFAFAVAALASVAFIIYRMYFEKKNRS